MVGFLMSSDSVKAVYHNQFGAKNGKPSPAGALQRNVRLKKLEALRTIPRDTRAPTVVQKADADMAQQEREMGNDDDQQNTGTEQPPAEKAPDGNAGAGSAETGSKPGSTGSEAAHDNGRATDVAGP